MVSLGCFVNMVGGGGGIVWCLWGVVIWWGGGGIVWCLL